MIKEQNHGYRLGFRLLLFFVLAGLHSLKDLGVEEADVDVANCAYAAAEGAHLAAWKYKESDREKFPATIAPLKTLPDQTDHIIGTFSMS